MFRNLSCLVSFLFAAVSACGLNAVFGIIMLVLLGIIVLQIFADRSLMRVLPLMFFSFVSGVAFGTLARVVSKVVFK